jgi:hypothetical protein
MMARDERLTGHKRGQSVRIILALCSLIIDLDAGYCMQTEPIAPEGFATSSVWYTERTS